MALSQLNAQQAVTITVPLPTSVDDAWEIFSSVFIALSDVPEVAILFPLEQDLIEELGVPSLQMSDIRSALASLHHIEIPPAAEGEWPKTVLDFFLKYLVYTPVWDSTTTGDLRGALAKLEAAYAA